MYLLTTEISEPLSLQEMAFFISDDLVKASILTKEYYENNGQPMPKVSQKFKLAWLKFYACHIKLFYFQVFRR